MPEKENISNGVNRLYEFSYLIPEELSNEEVENLQKDIDSFIMEEKGVFYTPPLTSQNKTLSKKPFYPHAQNASEIKNSQVHTRMGVRVYFEKKKGVAKLKTINFYLDPEKAEKLKQKLKQEKQILRFMFLTKKEPVMEVTKKTHRAKIKPLFQKAVERPAFAPTKPSKEKPKVELKEIDKKLDEILEE